MTLCESIHEVEVARLAQEIENRTFALRMDLRDFLGVDTTEQDPEFVGSEGSALNFRVFGQLYSVGLSYMTYIHLPRRFHNPWVAVRTRNLPEIKKRLGCA